MDVLMTPPLPLAEWLSVVEREYLSEFVPAGGAAVKFAILDNGAVDPAAACLVRLGQAQNMLTVQVDAGRTRIHLAHELFFTIARALPWGSLLQRYLEELFSAHAYPWPQPGVAMALADLAATFAVAPNLLSRHLVHLAGIGDSVGPLRRTESHLPQFAQKTGYRRRRL
jgi:hypothetical protein